MGGGLSPPNYLKKSIGRRDEMLKSIKLSCLTVVLIGIITTFSGCSVVENIEKKLVRGFSVILSEM